MRKYVALGVLALAPVAYAQGLKLAVFDRLKDQASEVVDLNLPKQLISMGLGPLVGNSDDPKVKRLAEGLQSVLVKSLEFDKEGVYTKADVQQLIAELSGSGWNLIISSTENHGRDVARIWIKAGGNGEPGGLRILSAEVKELAVIEIIGRVQLGDLENLDLHIPGINSGHSKPDKKNEEELY